MFLHVPLLWKKNKIKTKKENQKKPNNIRKPNKNVSKPPLPGCKSWSKKREHCQCSVSQKSVDILKQYSNCILSLYKGFKLLNLIYFTIFANFANFEIFAVTNFHLSYSLNPKCQSNSTFKGKNSIL